MLSISSVGNLPKPRHVLMARERKVPLTPVYDILSRVLKPPSQSFDLLRIGKCYSIIIRLLLKSYHQKRIAFPVFDKSPSSIFDSC
jgi:hypothetical protein